jgi:eukaryotic-like serine/threonine-protein kinase
MTDVKLETLGRYKIVDVIGRGAMGTVYKAVDPAIGRVVAIKTINLSLGTEELEEFEARFQQEIQAAGRFTHPNIVTIFDVGRTDQVAYMAMEYLNGRELKDLFAEGRRLNVETTVELILQAADGLAFAHDHDIVHRDVKPSNIMVINLPNGVLAKITDFGIARMSGSAVKTMTGVILGSPRYMSPEQVIGKSIDHRSDIFSLGVVLYETLTGAAPFDGDNLTAIMYATINAHPAPPSSLNPAAPQMLDLIVAKALAKKVDERYQGMREFASDLREVRRQLSGATGERPVLAIEMLTPMRPAAAVPPKIASGRLQMEATEEEQAMTLKLAKQFDSFAATLRLAALNQQTEEFREYISETQKMRAYTGKVETPAAPAAVAKVTPGPKPAPAFVPIPRGGHAATRLRGMDPSAVPSSNLIPVVVLGLLALAAVGLLIALLLR